MTPTSSLLPLAAAMPILAAIVLGGIAYWVSSRSGSKCASTNVLLWVLVGLIVLGPSMMVMITSQRIQEASRQAKSGQVVYIQDGVHVQPFP
jgi:hypothetical protein